MMTSNRGESAVARLLAYLSAGWCGLSLAVVGLFMTFSAAVGPMAVFNSAIEESVAVKIQKGLSYLLVLFLVAEFVLLPLGVATGRFLVRVVPPSIAMSPQRDRVVAATLCALLIFGLYWTLLLALLNGFRLHTERPDLAQISGFAMAAVWMTGVCGLLLHRFRRPRGFLERPFILVLRRFSTFSDRGLVALILRRARRGVPVVFLTPTRSRPGDWDVNLVGFAGLKFFRPWRSAPILIRAADDGWEIAANELIRRARVILLDVSETSGALTVEQGMISKANRQSDTICLRYAGPAARPIAILAGARVIEYSKSWAAAVPRMAVGLTIVLAGALFVVGVFVEYSNSRTTGWALSALPLALGSLYAYSAYMRPEVDRQTGSALKKAFGRLGI
jgi:hypothetical protein